MLFFCNIKSVILKYLIEIQIEVQNLPRDDQIKRVYNFILKLHLTYASYQTALDNVFKMEAPSAAFLFELSTILECSQPVRYKRKTKLSAILKITCHFRWLRRAVLGRSRSRVYFFTYLTFIAPSVAMAKSCLEDS